MTSPEEIEEIHRIEEQLRKEFPTLVKKQIDRVFDELETLRHRVAQLIKLTERNNGMLESNATINQTSSELKVLRKQVSQLKKILENKDIEIKKLREELTDAKQDSSNILSSWAELQYDSNNI
jgi:chromosome segregation ATPase|tara:strand:+ start:870 stop:1238 length:369 start_codon:yes stop_codon:yes gene_type:complete